MPSTEHKKPSARNAREAQMQHAAEERRVRVAELLDQRKSYREIALDVGVASSTVSNDVAIIREEWKQRAGQSYESHVAGEAHTLDLIEKALIMEVLAGKIDAIHALLRTMERRAKLLGLDRPFKLDVSGEVTDLAEAVESAILSALDELGIDTRQAGPVIHRHLTIVADQADAS